MAITQATPPAVAHRPSTTVSTRDQLRDPAYQAFWLLRAAFTLAPILFGLDKFFHVLVDWDHYLAPFIVRQTPWDAHEIMYVVGAIEIIVNLLIFSGFYDIALRDFGLFVAALALARLATAFDGSSTAPKVGR